LQFLAVPCSSAAVPCSSAAVPCSSAAVPCSSAAVPCSSLQFLAVPLQFLAVPLQFLAVPLQFLAVPCSSLQFLAVPCSSLQFLAVPCSSSQFRQSEWVLTHDCRNCAELVPAYETHTQPRRAGIGSARYERSTHDGRLPGSDRGKSDHQGRDDAQRDDDDLCDRIRRGTCHVGSVLTADDHAVELAFVPVSKYPCR
jgi:hypothetical protein